MRNFLIVSAFTVVICNLLKIERDLDIALIRRLRND